MNYPHIVKGSFLSRPNRFIAYVQILTGESKGKTVVCHVKNTGRCKELLLPEATVLLQYHPEASVLGRKTEYSLIGVFKVRDEDTLLINMDSQAPNLAAYEWLLGCGSACEIKREVTYGQSRFDLAFQLIEKEESGSIRHIPAFMEVKGVTLEEHNLALFPDAPTIRGIKHIEELIHAKKDGYETYLLFLIQMKGMTGFSPNERTQPELKEALQKAAAAGVHILAYDCQVTENSMTVDQPVPVYLD
ncbi:MULTISPECIES: DNA/RNA nuclease SfsA [Lacrimispora]|uniref:DNA/RNA nuclease SfsA n=1 Tax=Lacrimispora TaxID=2719231 RepID=UPI000BE2DA33|nr:DNA/RNA nuclease SfsA [Lacrimispora amygdalina]MDK2965987.1 sugar fermentation stimulation protein [Lacrimispora sp.]